MKDKLFRFPLMLGALSMALVACQTSQDSTPTEQPEVATEGEPRQEPMAVEEVVLDSVLSVTADFSLVQNEPVLALGEEGEWDSGVIRFPYIVRKDGMYHMFYEARAEIGESFLAIGYAISQNGIQWTKFEGNPILEGDGFGFDSLSVARPVVHVEEDGTWVLYYTGNDGEENRAIGLATATSPTGPWEISEVGLLAAGPSGAWDHGLILADQIIQTESGYRLYYSGRAASGRSAMIGLATSADGVIWEKTNDPTNDSTEPLFAESDPILVAGPGWDARATWTPNIFPYRDGWMMIYNSFGSLGIAFSDDGLNWSKYEDNPIYRNGSLFHPFVLQNDDDTYWIFYRNLNDDSIYLMEGMIVIE